MCRITDNPFIFWKRHLLPTPSHSFLFTCCQLGRFWCDFPSILSIYHLSFLEHILGTNMSICHVFQYSDQHFYPLRALLKQLSQIEETSFAAVFCCFHQQRDDPYPVVYREKRREDVATRRLCVMEISLKNAP